MTGVQTCALPIYGGRFDPETITSYELGAKGRIAGAGITYSAALFHYLFKNLQSITLDTSPTVPVYVVTISDVEATGLDAELQWQVAAPLRLWASGEYIDQSYQSQKNRPTGANDLTGQPYGTPELSFTAGLDFTTPLAGGLADFTLQGSHVGPQRCNADSATQGTCLTASAFKVGEARNRVDTRLGWTAAGQRWGVALVVNNLLDKRYVTNLSTLSSAVGVPYTASVTDPRKVQVEFSFKL